MAKRTSAKVAPVVASNVTAGPVAAPPAKAEASLVSRLAHLRELFKAATIAARNIELKQAELNTDRQGNYDAAMSIAIEAGDAATFSAAWDGWIKDLQTNADGIAVACKCVTGKPAKDGTVLYKIPSGLKSAVSVIKGAMALGIALVDDKGKARSFNAVRDDKTAAEAAKSEAATLANLTPTQIAQREVAMLCTMVAKAANALTLTDATETAKILRHVLEIATGEAGKDAQKAA